jgi:hypothetical protein
MALIWNDLICTPAKEPIDARAESWNRLHGDAFTPRRFTARGDMFFEADAGGIFWLNTGTAEVERVADNVPEFNNLLREEAADDWLLPGLIEALLEAGKVRAEGECYTYVTLPVFVEGGYTVENLNPVPAKEHFELTGSILRQLDDMPDGASVDIEVKH